MIAISKPNNELGKEAFFFFPMKFKRGGPMTASLTLASPSQGTGTQTVGAHLVMFTACEEVVFHSPLIFLTLCTAGKRAGLLAVD